MDTLEIPGTQLSKLKKKGLEAANNLHILRVRGAQHADGNRVHAQLLQEHGDALQWYLNH